MKKKVTENAPQLEKNERAAELLKDLNQLHINVIDALDQKNKIIAKQEQLLALKEDLLDSYRSYIEKREQEHHSYVKITGLIFLTIGIVSIICLIYNIIHT